MSPRLILLATVGGLALAVALGFGLGRLTSHPAPPPPPSAAPGRKVLYWYDPMRPDQHFDKPGKSPFMDMQLVPRYAGETPSQRPGVQVAAATVQSLGLRTAAAERGVLPSGLTAAGAIDFDERDVAVVQAKAAGFVQRTYGRAPGDVVNAGAPLADLLIPDWAGAQGEYLAVRRSGDAALVRAARQRLVLLGMPESLIAAVDRTGRVRSVATVATPIGGVIKTLGVRGGMAVMAGQSLAEVNGLSRVWLNAAVPEAMANDVRLGQSATATLTAFPGQSFNGRVTAILPQAETASRTLTVRIELANPGGRLRPGMFAAVQFGGLARPALLIPSEAVIRTGTRTLVMLAESGGGYRPAEIRAGREAGGRTEVLAGLSEGEKVVASGQFLLDSEASLQGLSVRPLAGASAPAAAKAPALNETRGRIEALSGDQITISHEPVPSIGWPAMTMTFRLEPRTLAGGFKVGDPVAFGFEQTAAGPVVRRLSAAGAAR